MPISSQAIHNISIYPSLSVQILTLALRSRKYVCMGSFRRPHNISVLYYTMSLTHLIQFVKCKNKFYSYHTLFRAKCSCPICLSYEVSLANTSRHEKNVHPGKQTKAETIFLLISLPLVFHIRQHLPNKDIASIQAPLYIFPLYLLLSFLKKCFVPCTKQYHFC